MLRLYLLFASIYLLEGTTEVPFLLNVYLKKVLSFQPFQIGQILFLGGLWFVLLKPLIGFIADFWTRLNKRWVLAFGLVCSATGWQVIANAQSPMMITLGVSLKVIAIAILDVLIDGMIVIASHSRNRTFIQSLVYGCRFGGAMLCSVWAGARIAESVAAFTQIYYLFSLFSLLILVPVLIYRERTEEGDLPGRKKIEDSTAAGADKVTLREKFGQLAHPAFGWLLLLLFLYSLGADTATYFEPIIEERFGGDFLGGISAWYYGGILAGILSFPLFRLRLSMKTLFIISLFGWSLAELSCLGMARWNGALIYFCGGFFNAYSSIALLTVAVAMCKIRGVETFAFAFAISVKNLMDHSNVLIGGYVMETVGITNLFIISSLCGLFPFLVLHKIDFREV
jgi:predicted MFS family arabinose efflux permease